MNKEIEIPDGFMANELGHLVAIDNIRPIDLERDELVKEKAQKMLKIHKELRSLKKELLDDLQAFVELSVERYDVTLGGSKGNLNLPTFDGKYQIMRQMSENLTFDEGLQAAKVLIDECLRDWTKDSGSEIKTLVDHAFRVDKKGKLNFGAILGLRQLKFNDDRWNKAMEAISDSVKVTGTKAYVRLQVRDDNGDYKTIPLDIAAV